MRDVTETKLPGVGVRHDFESDAGDTIGVLVHHDGRREVVIYDRKDPDACSSLLPLSHDDARTLAELLGAAQVTEEVSDAAHHMLDQSIAWVRVDAGGPGDGVSLDDGANAVADGATVVAVIRNGVPHASPGGDYVTRQDDLLIAVGDAASLERMRHRLEPHR